MARESYQQSIGNPLQRDRLPASLPTIELLCRPAGQVETVAVILCWGVCLIASSMVAWLVLRQGHALPAPPLLVLGLVVFAMMYLIGDGPSPTQNALSSE